MTQITLPLASEFKTDRKFVAVGGIDPYLRSLRDDLIFHSLPNLLQGNTELKISPRLLATSEREFNTVVQPKIKRLMEPVQYIALNPDGEPTGWKLTTMIIDSEGSWNEDHFTLKWNPNHLNDYTNPSYPVIRNYSITSKLPKTGSTRPFYDFIAPYRPEQNQQFTTTPWFSIEDARLSFDKEDQTFQEYKFLKNRFIKPALKGTEQHTDLRAELLEKRQNRKVTHIAFNVYRNENYSEHRTDKPELLKLLIRHHVNLQKAHDLLDDQTISSQQIRNAITAWKQWSKDKDIRNPGGSLLRAIQQAWNPNDPKNNRRQKTIDLAIAENKTEQQQTEKANAAKIKREKYIKQIDTFLQSKSTTQQQAIAAEFASTLTGFNKTKFEENHKSLLTLSNWAKFLETYDIR